MKIVQTDLSMAHFSKPVALTIGNFDGMHLGHVALLERLRAYAKQHEAHAAVMTFSKHPSELFYPNRPLYKLTLQTQKYALIEKCGIDYLLVLDFSPAFANQSVEQFFKALLKYMPLVHCMLGHDAVLGHQRSGNQLEVQRVAQLLGFTVEYLLPVLVEGVAVSSSLIRQKLASGQIAAAEKLLGRKINAPLPT